MVDDFLLKGLLNYSSILKGQGIRVNTMGASTLTDTIGRQSLRERIDNAKDDEEFRVLANTKAYPIAFGVVCENLSTYDSILRDLDIFRERCERKQGVFGVCLRSAAIDVPMLIQADVDGVCSEIMVGNNEPKKAKVKSDESEEFIEFWDPQKEPMPYPSIFEIEGKLYDIGVSPDTFTCAVDDDKLPLRCEFHYYKNIDGDPHRVKFSVKISIKPDKLTLYEVEDVQCDPGGDTSIAISKVDGIGRPIHLELNNGKYAQNMDKPELINLDLTVRINPIKPLGKIVVSVDKFNL